MPRLHLLDAKIGSEWTGGRFGDAGSYDGVFGGGDEQDRLVERRSIGWNA